MGQLGVKYKAFLYGQSFLIKKIEENIYLFPNFLFSFQNTTSQIHGENSEIRNINIEGIQIDRNIIEVKIPPHNYVIKKNFVQLHTSGANHTLCSVLDYEVFSFIYRRKNLESIGYLSSFEFLLNSYKINLNPLDLGTHYVHEGYQSKMSLSRLQNNDLVLTNQKMVDRAIGQAHATTSRPCRLAKASQPAKVGRPRQLGRAKQPDQGCGPQSLHEIFLLVPLTFLVYPSKSNL